MITVARIIRVFPRRTKATPNDDMAFIGEPPLWTPPADEVHVSCAFTWDRDEAKWLARAWGSRGYVVRYGGPGFDEPGGPFVAGRFLKPGYTITSRGCPNACWFCYAWRREGRKVRELTIEPGYNVLDDNLLACSSSHIRAVFDMLARQRIRAELTGGLEAARFERWHAKALREIGAKQWFFAYDTSDDWQPLRAAAAQCWTVGISRASHRVRCYVLIGYPGDSREDAACRLIAVKSLGVVPMAMLWRGDDRKRNPIWAAFQRSWARPAAIYARRPMPVPV